MLFFINVNNQPQLQVECHPDAESEAIIVLSLAALGAVANLSLMGLIIIRLSSFRIGAYCHYGKSELKCFGEIWAITLLHLHFQE